MKANLTLALALVLICSGAALAQGTPDWMTPHQETICNSENGAAFGLCNAYCEAMDCNSANPQASATACTKVKTKFMNLTGRPLPCETCPPPPAGTTCPCTDLPEFNAVLSSSDFTLCGEFGLAAGKYSATGIAAATCSLQPPLGGACGVQNSTGIQVLNTTPEQGSACMQLIVQSCGPV